MTNNTEDVELELLVRATQYVMKQDPVLKEYSRHSPGHFVRIIERMLEFNQQEANRQKIELLDEIYQKWGGDESLKHFTITAGEEVLLAEIKHRREQLEKEVSYDRLRL